MGNFCSKCGGKADAKEKYKSREETKKNHHDITILTNKGNTIEKQTPKPDKNDSNNAGSTGAMVSDNKEPSDQKPDVSVSHYTDKKQDVNRVTGQKSNGLSKKKKRYDAESSDSSETSDSSSNSDSSDSDYGSQWKNSRRKYKNKHGGTTLVSKKMTVLGNYMNIGSGATNVNLTITNNPPRSAVEIPEEERTRFEPFNEHTRKEFFSQKSQPGPSDGNFIYLPEHSKGRVEEVIVSKFRNEWEKSVCRIEYPGGSGSGFRVGRGTRNLLCTAWHVVEGIMDAGMTFYGSTEMEREKKLDDGRVWCVFNHLENDFSVSESNKFYFKPFVHYRNLETDTAILELKENRIGTPMPPPFVHFARPVLEKPFYLVGHPNRGPKKWCLIDSFINMESVVTANHINIVRRWCQDNRLLCEANREDRLDNPKRWLFHVAENFTKGASGCPGLVINPPHVSVVTVLVRGYPDWVYDPNISDQEKAALPLGYRVEQGTNLESLFRDMQDENPGLCMEIFNV